jgi:hypothetical protein
LQRQHDKKGSRQRQVISAAGAGQGQEFAQCGKRGEREEHDDAGLAQGEGEADQRDHHPPRLDPGVQVADDRARRIATAQNETNQRCGEKDGSDASEQKQRLIAGAH